MFITLQQIKIALDILEKFHIFFGSDFLVFKKGDIPVGNKISFPIDSESRKFMDKYYRPKKSSSYYYRPMRSVRKTDKKWLTNKFPGGTAQGTRTRGKIASALLHDSSTQMWGWNNNYVQILKPSLGTREQLPILALAVWLYRERSFDTTTTLENLIDTFIQEFKITDEEINYLFDPQIPLEAQKYALLQDKRISWEELEQVIGSPPDSQPGEGGTLTYLKSNEVGPVSELTFVPAERLNLITGDNGLGKTFLLECIWWSLTGQWTSFPAYPRQKSQAREAQITFEISSRSSVPEKEKTTVEYTPQIQGWAVPTKRPTIPGLLIYARVDSSFAVWDPERLDIDGEGMPRSLIFSKDEVWQGLTVSFRGGMRSYSEGLLRVRLRVSVVNLFPFT